MNVFNLNVPYIYFFFFIPLAIYQNPSLVGYILLTWFYPYQSILPVPLLDYFSDFLLLDYMNVLINLS